MGAVVNPSYWGPELYPRIARRQQLSDSWGGRPCLDFYVKAFKKEYDIVFNTVESPFSKLFGRLQNVYKIRIVYNFYGNFSP